MMLYLPVCDIKTSFHLSTATKPEIKNKCSLSQEGNSYRETNAVAHILELSGHKKAFYTKVVFKIKSF